MCCSVQKAPKMLRMYLEKFYSGGHSLEHPSELHAGSTDQGSGSNRCPGAIWTDENPLGGERSLGSRDKATSHLHLTAENCSKVTKGKGSIRLLGGKSQYKEPLTVQDTETYLPVYRAPQTWTILVLRQEAAGTIKMSAEWARVSSESQSAHQCTCWISCPFTCAVTWRW